ncbi:MAG: cupin domain-containing protein [Actinomycetota bacterium]|nr:cupin domain-containing protein [Actinomycetota bacterium]
MELNRNSATLKGPNEMFTGDVYIDRLSNGNDLSPMSVGAVHFTPGSRSAWHSHRGGQTLYVTEGRGLVQSRGGDVVKIKVGDVVVAGDGEEHWHGSDPDHFMTHISMTIGEATWGPHITDGEYYGTQK